MIYFQFLINIFFLTPLFYSDFTFVQENNENLKIKLIKVIIFMSFSVFSMKKKNY